MSLQKLVQPINGCTIIAASVCTLLFAIDANAAMMAARVSVTGTSNATTVGTVTSQTPGPTLFAATNPSNFGDISLLTGATTVALGGVPFKQADGVIIATPNQFRFTAIGDRNMIESPGELSDTIPSGFPNGMWLSTTLVSGAGAEDNFKVALAHFPFADGWIAGHVRSSATPALDGTFFSGNTANVTVTPQSAAPFAVGHYKLAISGVDSRVDGMLYAMGEVNSSSGNVVPVGILPDGSGWDIRVNDQGLNFPATETAPWSFVYVPYKAMNLVAAGNLGIDDATSVVVRKGKGSFTASRVDLGTNGSITPPGTPDGVKDLGRFLITIPGKTDVTGYLMVGVSKYATSGGNSAADDNFVVWEYSSLLGGFLVDTMDLTGADLQNSDIYFAYFDYANPITPTPEPGTACLAAIGMLALPIFGLRRRAAA